MTASEGRAEADRAMEWLRRAVAAGYHNVANMRSDANLDPLRSRPDFQLLMMDLEFPDDPFARGD
jgi:serine/threonine-protein kinase